MHDPTEDLRSQQLFRFCLDALPLHIAILDEAGLIVWVNAAWNQFALLNGALVRFGVGTNYLNVCDAAQGTEAEDGKAAATGIRRILAGEAGEFCFEYPCHAPWGENWFEMRARRVLIESQAFILTTHENVTQRHRDADLIRHLRFQSDSS